MNSTPPPLPGPANATAGHAKRGPWLALSFLAIGIFPALVCLLLIYTTHFKRSSVDALLGTFFIADTVCALISGIGIGLIAGRQWWLRLLIALPVAAGLWLINALVGLFAGCALTTPGR
jgi:hypothetical protein